MTRIYSGRKSKKFWEKINSLNAKDKHHIYTLGCILQDVEHKALAAIEEVENKRRKKK